MMRSTLRAAAWILVLMSASRGADYIIGNPNDQGILESMNSGGPPFIWGIACLFTAVTVCIGLLFGWRKSVVIGAVLGACSYFLFGALRLEDTIFTPPADDWRYVTDYWGTAALWAVVAISAATAAPLRKVVE